MGPAAGCGFDVGYAVSVAGGQIDILAHSVPISEAIHSGSLSPAEIEKLRLLLDFRRLDYPEPDPPDWRRLLVLRKSGGEVLADSRPTDWHLRPPYAPGNEENYRLHCGL